jgi:hypothetical protein
VEPGRGLGAARFRLVCDDYWGTTAPPHSSDHFADSAYLRRGGRSTVRGRTGVGDVPRACSARWSIGCALIGVALVACSCTSSDSSPTDSQPTTSSVTTQPSSSTASAPMTPQVVAAIAAYKRFSAAASAAEANPGCEHAFPDTTRPTLWVRADAGQGRGLRELPADADDFEVGDIWRAAQQIPPAVGGLNHLHLDRRFRPDAARRVPRVDQAHPSGVIHTRSRHADRAANLALGVHAHASTRGTGRHG